MALRVLFIARYLQAVNHQKVAALAAQEDIELYHLAPDRWTDALATYQQEMTAPEGYRLLTARVVGGGDIHRFAYWPPTLHLSRIRPDIIHIEEEPDSVAALEAALARAVLARRARLVLFTWQNILRRRRILPRLVARFTLSQANAIIAGNQEVASVIRRQGYAGPVAVLPQLGVDTDVFRPLNVADLRRKLGLVGFCVGYVGRFVAEKGIDTLIDAVSGMPEASLLLVGRGPALEALWARAAAAGMSHRLVVVEPVPHHEVPLYLNCLDVLALPSRTTDNWKEQFGHVLIEAMACEAPVVGADSGAIPEVIGDAGLVFAEGDAAALRAHLERLAADAELRRRLAAAGRERVLQRYTHQRIAEQTVALWREVLGR